MNLFKENLQVKGHVNLTCLNPDRSIKWSEDLGFNTITIDGFAQLALLAGDPSAVPFTYLELGTDSTAASNSQTALLAKITDSGLARAAATVSRVTTTETDDTLQLYHEWTATATKTVEEVGIFNDPTAGVMLGRKLTGSKTVDSGDILQGTYRVSFGV